MWPNPLETVDLVTFTEEILNGKFHFLCSVSEANWNIWPFKLDNFSEFQNVLSDSPPPPHPRASPSFGGKKSIKFRWMKSLAENLIEFFSFFNKAKHMNQTSQINKIIATRNRTTSPNDEPKFFYFLWLCIESVE